MTTTKMFRYDLVNLPISDITRKGLTTENINYIGVVGRMLSLQDDIYEEHLDKIAILLEKQSCVLNQLMTDVRELKEKVDGLELAIDKINGKVITLEEKIKIIEKRLDDYYLSLKNHKHEI